MPLLSTPDIYWDDYELVARWVGLAREDYSERSAVAGEPEQEVANYAAFYC